jgi:hypothetical protein
MMNRFLYIFFLTLLSSQSLSHEQAGITLEKNSFLTAMFSIAQKPNHYFLFDIRGKKIFLMSRGIVLREWIADQVRFTGDPVPVQIFSMERKNVRFSELRHNIDVDDNSTDDSDADAIGDNKIEENKRGGKFELDALELDDMPTSYVLFLNGGISINIRTHKGFGAVFKNTSHSIMWHAYYPIRAIWSSLKKDTFTAIDISFKDEKEAQALFWAVADEAECILLFSGLGDREAFQFQDIIDW